MPKFKPKHDHLASYASFQFALHVAVLAVLIGVFVMLVGNMGLVSNFRGNAAGLPQTQNAR